MLAIQFIINGVSDAVTGYMLDQGLLDGTVIEDPRTPPQNHRLDLDPGE